MPRRLLLFVILLCATSAAQAASFDCKKAATPTEKRICADTELSRLDEQLGYTYADALAQSGDKTALRAEQNRWLKTSRNPCLDLACLRTAYLDRLSKLSPPSPAYRNLAEAEAAVCRALTLQTTACRRSGGGDIGKITSHSFQYATWCLDANPIVADRCEENAIALFATAADGHVTRWHLRQDDAGNMYQPPMIHQTAQGLLLDLPVRVQGTGNFNDSDLFLFQGEQWRPVDIESWQDDLAKRLPKGRQIWKGIWPDWQTLTASAALYAPKDANCCPSAGSVAITLSLVGTRIAIKQLRLSNHAEQ